MNDDRLRGALDGRMENGSNVCRENENAVLNILLLESRIESIACEAGVIVGVDTSA